MTTPTDILREEHRVILDAEFDTDGIEFPAHPVHGLLAEDRVREREQHLVLLGDVCAQQPDVLARPRRRGAHLEGGASCCISLSPLSRSSGWRAT